MDAPDVLGRAGMGPPIFTFEVGTGTGEHFVVVVVVVVVVFVVVLFVVQFIFRPHLLRT
jgi:hypothetical protein